MWDKVNKKIIDIIVKISRQSLLNICEINVQYLQDPKPIKNDKPTKLETKNTEKLSFYKVFLLILKAKQDKI